MFGIKKPSEVTEAKVVFNKFLPFGSFLAFAFFGRVFVKNKDKEKWEEYEKSGKAETIKYHELIHIKRQAQNSRNSWLLFYLRYIWQFLRNSPVRGMDYAYYMTPYELEAYGNEDDPDYIEKHKDSKDEHKKYKIDSVSRKDSWFNTWYNLRGHITFQAFVNRSIKPRLGMECLEKYKDASDILQFQWPIGEEDKWYN